MTLPQVIQGGMGVGVSNWRLARAVSQAGQLGVVSGTMLDTVFARRLQDGDPDGQMRQACNNFPDQQWVNRVFDTYFIPGGKSAHTPYRSVPMFGLKSTRQLIELTILANFAEVFLAKDGHTGIVGINLLEKIQLPTLPSLYGAMLAGTDYVLMGAGIPKAIPGILDALAEHQPVSLRVDIQPNADGIRLPLDTLFDPNDYLPARTLKRPKFIAVVASHTLALTLAKKSSGHVDGFVLENYHAGGHNAPPRGPLALNFKGEPIYGPRDEVDLEEIKKIGRPFWLAGSYGTFDRLQEAVSLGAAGVQVGTPFAFCQESGITQEIKDQVLRHVRQDTLSVFTDPIASACGYPFKVVQLEETLSQDEVFSQRSRICDLGYLRSAYQQPDGTIGWRCPGEPESDYLRKGGKAQDAAGRKCLCNGLTATIGLGQTRNGGAEPALVTAGTAVSLIRSLLKDDSNSYGASDVLEIILKRSPAQSVC